MAKNVIILGAGASASDGAPTMGNFYEVAMETGETLKDDSASHEAFKCVEDAYLELGSAEANVKMAYADNIENLFATFEMANVLGKLGRYTKDQIELLLPSMKRTISDTIEMNLNFSEFQGNVYPPSTYGKFAKKIADKFSSPTYQPNISIITFNYDIGFDYALEMNGVSIDYCLKGPPRTRSIPFLKLHGSLNWSRCNECEQILYLGYEDWKTKYGTPVNMQNRNVFHICTSRELGRIKHEHNLTNEPYIIPPTWNKTRHQEEIQQVWQRASEELSTAKQLFIIGFSVGTTDQFFRHLFALSLARSQNLRKIFIINNNVDAFNRVQGLLGDRITKTLQSFLMMPFESRVENVADLILNELPS